jgi:hypothetical protein
MAGNREHQLVELQGGLDTCLPQLSRWLPLDLVDTKAITKKISSIMGPLALAGSRRRICGCRCAGSIFITAPESKAWIGLG